MPGAALRAALGHACLRGDGRKRAAHHGPRRGERAPAEAGRQPSRERLAGHQRSLGSARRVVRGGNQRHFRLAPRDVPPTLARWPVRALPRRAPASQPHFAGNLGYAVRSRRGSGAPRPQGRPAPGAGLRQGAVRPLGSARSGPGGERRFGGRRRADRVRVVNDN